MVVGSSGSQQRENLSAGGRACPVCRKVFALDIRVCPTDAVVLSDVSDCLIGTVIAQHYEVLCQLGEGGTATVYKARHELMDRIVALKVLKSSLSTEHRDRLKKRFQQEARAASSLSHENLITLYDFGFLDTGEPYIIMDFVQGKSIAELIAEEGTIRYDRLVKMMVQVCNGLHHAHGKGIIHRDIKPSNIIVVPTEANPEFVKVVDFGIAKILPTADVQSFQLTQAGFVFGSPLFMSPEQVMGAGIDVRSDIYSVGATMYNALTGVPPLNGSSLAEVLAKKVSEEPPPFSAVIPGHTIPKVLEDVVRRCLAISPGQRFQRMQELGQHLSGLIAVEDTVRISRRSQLTVGVLLASADRDACSNVQSSLSGAEDVKLVGSARNSDEAIDLFMQLVPQVVLIDLELPGKGGVETARELKISFPSAKVLLFCGKENQEEVLNALELGADGYIMMDAPDRPLAPAVRALAHGAAWVDPHITGCLLKRSQRESEPAESRPAGLDLATRPEADNSKMDHGAYLEALGRLYEKEEKYDEAEALYHGAMGVMEKSRGWYHPDVARLLEELGDLYRRRNKWRAAENLYLRAVDIRAHSRGSRDADVADSLRRLGEVLYDQGDLSRAEETLRRALLIAEKLREPDDPLTGSILRSLLLVFDAQGKTDEAALVRSRLDAGEVGASPA